MSPHTGRPRLEVADIFRTHGEEYRLTHKSSSTQLAVMNHIEQCRTAILGGHLDQCDTCGFTRISYNSCRDRHCPKCQSLKKAEWLEARLERLLPVVCFHVVFTLPDDLNPLALYNKQFLYGLLFDTTAQTLKTIAADPQHLGAADIGFTAVLHTWGQNLLLHPHLHCVVTGGGLDKSGQRWISSSPEFFLPVNVLGSLFKKKFMAALKQAWREGRLDLSGPNANLANPNTWYKFTRRLYKKDWVVFSKPPFGGPEQVFRYLGRYTHRVAISNHRLISLENGQVTFRYKDYKDGARKKELTLEAVEFIRRFLLHVLPKGFTRIRHYGLLPGKNVHTKLEHARHLLEPPTKTADTKPKLKPPRSPWWERLLKLTGIDIMACPNCKTGRLTCHPLLLEPDSHTNRLAQPLAVPIQDSS